MTNRRGPSRCDLARRLLDRRGELEIRVSGRSMLPSLRPDDTMLLVPINERLSLGDLVVYPGRRSLEPVLHRAVHVDENVIRLVGDNAIVFTDIRREDAVGMVRALFWGGSWRPVSVASEHGLCIAELNALICGVSASGKLGLVTRFQNERRAECLRWRACVCG